MIPVRDDINRHEKVEVDKLYFFSNLGGKIQLIILGNSTTMDI